MQLQGDLELLRAKYDAVVVGAGPAGSCSAIEMAKRGLRVLLLERKRDVGVPVRCGEYVPAALAKEVEIPSGAIAQRVSSMRTFICGRLASERYYPGLILKREQFDAHLAESACAVGARLLTGCRVLALDRKGIVVKRADRVQPIRADIIVGADGALSMTARSMGMVHQELLLGLQVETMLSRVMDYTEVHFMPELLGGYGWVFPKGRTANVGVGAKSTERGNLRRFLWEFLEMLSQRGLVERENILRYTGGPIPAGGPFPITVKGNRILVGDAAGHTDPLTGGGIWSAVICGKMAGETASEAVQRGRESILGSYDQRWRTYLGSFFQRRLKKRKEMEEGWKQGDFFRLIRRNWVAFDEFYS